VGSEIMNGVLKKLEGGDRRSIGRINQNRQPGNEKSRAKTTGKTEPIRSLYVIYIEPIS
jgi:hypothetical protein